MYIQVYVNIYTHTTHTTHTHTHCLVTSAHLYIQTQGTQNFVGAAAAPTTPSTHHLNDPLTRHQILPQLYQLTTPDITTINVIRISSNFSTQSRFLSLARSLAHSLALPLPPLAGFSLSSSLNDSWQQRGAGGALLRLVCSRDRTGNTGPGSLRSLR
jgi:hypothetical protein